FLLVANATLFGSLLFGYAFLWTIAPGWPPPAFMEPSLPNMLAAAGGAVLAAGGTAMAVRNNQNGSKPVAALLAAVAGALGLVVAFAVLLWSAPSAAGHAYNATIVVLGSYGLFHAVLTSLMLLFLLARHGAGYMSQRRRGELSIVMVWSIYLFVVTGLIILAVYLPGLVG
ncbi:MAG: cytochrome ubiquinol oxidase subunit I, partial [Hoeflea sp.]